jgi:transcriptional regulator with XRE-family HTH domain
MSFIIRQRLRELKREQRDLAAAAQVTESYISQLLSRKKAPPAIERTDLYDRMDAFLEFPRGHLAAMAQAQRLEELKRKLAEIPVPLFREVRELILRKCKPETRILAREIFEQQTFGELERLVSQALLSAAKGVARDGLKAEKWMRRSGKLRSQSQAQFRAQVLEFLETDVVNISARQSSVFLDPLIESWDIDLKTFKVEVWLDKRWTSARTVCFQFMETGALPGGDEEPGLKEFLRNPGMSCNISGEELTFLKSLQFHRFRPTALYYYRELQSLRDPLHFPSPPKNGNVKSLTSNSGPFSPRVTTRANPTCRHPGSV